MRSRLRLGLGTFGDITVDAEGRRSSDAATIRQVIEQAELADALGVDSFGLGEHHRADFAISSPEVVLGAIAARTTRMKLGTTVTVLSSDDPVRVMERFATLDAVSRGRAEITVGRGSFTESFPLFGYDLKDYGVLFEEKLDLLSVLLPERPASWSGTTRRALVQADVRPKTEHGLEVWVGVGGTPESVVRAGRYGFGMMLAVIGGPAWRFKPYVELYREALSASGHPDRPIGVYSAGYVADSDEQALEEAYAGFERTANTIGRERGWPPFTKERFAHDVGPDGSTYAGSPETVAQKIAATVRTLGVQRFDLNYATASLTHERLLHSIELFGQRVIPRVHELLADTDARQEQYA